jgi:hypothetical protein
LFEFDLEKKGKEMVLDFSGFNFDQGFIYKSLLSQLSWNKDYQFTSEIKIFKDLKINTFFNIIAKKVWINL